jgi:hypothetical protein
MTEREHSHTMAMAIGKAPVSADMVILQTSLKIRSGVANMKTDEKTKSPAQLLRAQIRLSMLARMVRVNIEESPAEEDIPEVMESILAACGVEAKN